MALSDSAWVPHHHLRHSRTNPAPLCTKPHPLVTRHITTTSSWGRTQCHELLNPPMRRCRPGQIAGQVPQRYRPEQLSVTFPVGQATHTSQPPHTRRGAGSANPTALLTPDMPWAFEDGAQAAGPFLPCLPAPCSGWTSQRPHAPAQQQFCGLLSFPHPSIAPQHASPAGPSHRSGCSSPQLP